MLANELWKKYSKNSNLHYDVWAFGDDPDGLAKLVYDGIKTATTSGYVFYEMENEELPKENEYSVILNSKEEAVCIIQTTNVYVVPFNEVSEEHAYKEGENTRTLEEWRTIHRKFFMNECKEVGIEFSEEMLVVCEEFKVVYKEEAYDSISM